MSSSYDVKEHVNCLKRNVDSKDFKNVMFNVSECRLHMLKSQYNWLNFLQKIYPGNRPHVCTEEVERRKNSGKKKVYCERLRK